MIKIVTKIVIGLFLLGLISCGKSETEKKQDLIQHYETLEDNGNAALAKLNEIDNKLQNDYNVNIGELRTITSVQYLSAEDKFEVKKLLELYVEKVNYVFKLAEDKYLTLVGDDPYYSLSQRKAIAEALIRKI